MPFSMLLNGRQSRWGNHADEPEDGSDPYENAKQWVEDNQDVVEQWLDS